MCFTKRGAKLGLIILTGTMLSACGSKVIDYPQYSGFLVDYSGLRRSNVIEGGVVMTNPRYDLASYSTFHVDPVMVYLAPTAKAYNKNPKTIKKSAAKFRKTIENSLRGKYTVVDAPGEGVLVLKFAITDFEDLEPLKDTKVNFEASFHDGATGERVAAFAYGHKPKTYGQWGTLLANRITELRSDLKVYHSE